MKLSQYGYDFSADLLAKYPAENRDESRLMVVNRAKGTIEHRIFKEIIEYFDEKDLFIFNDTKVFPARLYGNKEKTGAEIEIFLLRELNRELRLWDVLVDPARKIRIGNKLYFGDDDLLVAEVIDNTTSRGRTLRFLFDGSYEEFKETLFKLGETPLPKWVREKVEPEDAERYQTIFASKEGAVAAPTAGMHFSKHLFKRMEIKGIEKAFITLHVGLGNFRTVDVEDLSKHKMDSEQFFVDEPTAETVNKTKREGHKIVSIGTTVMRTLDRRHDQADGGLDQQVHLRPVRIFGGRRHGDQLPASLLDPTDDGFGIRRLRPDNECLQNSQRGGLPLRNLWRRDADSLRKITIFAEDRRRFGNLLRASPRDCSHLSLSLRKINFREVRYGSTTRQLFALHPARAFFAEQAKKSSFPTGGHSEHTAPGDEEKISTNGIEQDTIRLSGSGSVCPGYGRGASVPAALAGDAGARQ